MTQAEIIHTAELRLRQAGLLPMPIIADGHKHRCPVEGKPKGQDGEALSWLVKDIEDREAEAVRELLEQGLSIREIAKELDLSKSNVHRLKQKLGAADAP